MFPWHLLAPLNALLNSSAAVCLLAGRVFIRRRRLRAHRFAMLAAFVLSAAFFASYALYHYHVGEVHFTGQGWVRPVYFTILISHVGLALVIVPLVLITLVRALGGRFHAHRAIARVAWPLWIYVSVTGVIVYLLLYQLYTPRFPN